MMARLPGCLVLLAGLLCIVTASRPTTKRSHERPTGRDSVDGRLPRDVIPYHYVIDITPDIYLSAPPFPFDGTVKISVSCVTATNTITLNYYLITILDVTVTVSPDSEFNPASPGAATFTLEPAADFVHITVNNALQPGAKYDISVTYSGIVQSNDWEYGIYYDSYVAADGTTKYILTTQFEDIGARQMFPCMDEADLKATFSVTVAHMPSFTAISNMPVISTVSRPNGWIATTYDVSPIMSTYHLCICVGDLQYIETNWQGITTYPVRIYSRPEIIGQMAFVANISATVQKWLEQETNVPYGLPKMDHIALPTKGGAMENWGLITYGEEVFAVSSETSSAYGKQYIGSFVAHEVAHQWYGNLLTFKWWDDIWLNEGLGTYYDYLPLNSLGWSGSEPQQLDTQYFMESDQKNTSDPVRKQIDTVWDSGYSFVGSTYPKGGAMIRMLEGILSKGTLRRGLTNYLNKFNHSNVVTDDLWQSLTEQAASESYYVDVKRVMDPWLNQMGLPVLNVVRQANGTAVLTQKQLLYPPNQQINVVSPWNYKWTIPLTVVTAATNNWDTRPADWFDITQSQKILAGLPTNLNDWVIINAKQLMFYRVNYDDASRAAIVAQLVSNHTVIHHQSRCSLIDDTFTLARASYVDETDAMELTRYLKNEVSYNPWYSALKFTSLSERMLRNVNWYSNFVSYMLSILEPVFTKLGWVYYPTEIPDDQTLRSDIISATCSYGYQTCVNNAWTEFVLYRQNPAVNSVNPNNLPTVLCAGVNRGTDADWDMVFNQYQARKASQIREERNAYLYGLACSNNTVTLDRLLTYIVNGVLIAPRDQYRATLYLSKTRLGADKVWNYFDNQWTTVPSGMSKFSVLRSMTRTFADQASLDKLNSLIAKYPPQSQSQWNSFNQMQLLVQQNIVWLTSNHDSLRDWIATYVPPAFKQSPELPLPLSMDDHWRSWQDPAADPELMDAARR